MTPAPQINIPNLDGLGLPKALNDAIRQAFMYLQSLFSAVRGLQNASAAGVTSYLQKNIPASAPTGTKIYVSDYQHYLVFGTYIWQFAPGDQGSDYFVDFASTPGAGSGLWHACDGSTINYLKSDGSLGSRTLPNTVATAAFAKETSGYNPTISAATAPTFVGASDTTSLPSASVTIVQGTGGSIIVSNATHTHTVTPTGTVSVAGGPPVANYSVVRYYRQ